MTPQPPQSPRDAPASGAAVVQSLIVTLRQGLHARPAAVLAQRAKAFGASTTLSAHGRNANARSVVAIMALGVRHGDELTIQADGADAAQAVAGLLMGIREALRMESAAGHGAVQIAAPPQRSAALPKPAQAAGVLSGVTAVPGFAVGRAARIERREIAVTEAGAGAAHERAELELALSHVRARLQRVAATGGSARSEIIAAHLE